MSRRTYHGSTNGEIHEGDKVFATPSNENAYEGYPVEGVVEWDTLLNAWVICSENGKVTLNHFSKNELVIVDKSE